MPIDERVLCIPTAQFHAIGSFQGFQPATDALRQALLNPSLYSFRDRSHVETDPTFKQLIPYIVLRSGDSIFHYRRGRSGAEKRLQSLRSIGIGGHISEQDAAGTGDPYTNGMMRELFEEVQISGSWTDTLLGFINDDRSPVGQVHLGIVHVMDLERADVRSNESALTDAGFALLEELIKDREQFETWSQFTMEILSSKARSHRTDPT